MTKTVTVDEAAIILDVSGTHAQRLLKKHEIEPENKASRRPPEKYLYRRSDVEALAGKRAQDNASHTPNTPGKARRRIRVAFWLIVDRYGYDPNLFAELLGMEVPA